ncbi:MAG: hypothetical protein R3F07_15005 [Opitutaceae bacterium]
MNTESRATREEQSTGQLIGVGGLRSRFRTLFVLHATWMVNSLAHRQGYRNHPTSDESRNNAIVGLIAHGEGWHNNHHHCQNSVNHGHRWWEIDFTFLVIYFLGIFSWPMTWIGWGQHRPVRHLKYFSHRRQKITTLFPERTRPGAISVAATPPSSAIRLSSPLGATLL